MNRVVNIAGYKFVELHGLDSLRKKILSHCQKNELKGSVLLSKNGINFFLAGSQEPIDTFLALLNEDPRLSEIRPTTATKSGPKQTVRERRYRENAK